MECLWSVVGIAVLIVLAMIYDRIKFRRLAAERAGENFDTFRAAFTDEEVPECVLRAVYRELQGYCGGVVDFAVRADDNLFKMYGAEDVEDIANDVLRECGYRFPVAEVVEEPVVVNTVRDLVLAIAACPKAE